MNARHNPDARPAVQYLIWALEEIEKEGNQAAADHARLAMEALRENLSPAGKP
jgi:hypothetical protein